MYHLATLKCNKTLKMIIITVRLLFGEWSFVQAPRSLGIRRFHDRQRLEKDGLLKTAQNDVFPEIMKRSLIFFL
jgi:hypothetical protein